MKEKTWAVTELSHPLPSGEVLQLTCAPNYPNKQVYSLEIRKEETIIYQVDSDNLYDVKELLKSFSEAIKEFERYLHDATLFDDAITAARMAKAQIERERANVKIFEGLAIKKPDAGNIPAASLLGKTEA